MDLQPLHSTKDTQSEGAELHESRTTEYEEYEDYIVGYVCFIDMCVSNVCGDHISPEREPPPVFSFHSV